MSAAVPRAIELRSTTVVESAKPADWPWATTPREPVPVAIAVTFTAVRVVPLAVPSRAMPAFASAVTTLLTIVAGSPSAAPSSWAPTSPPRATTRRTVGATAPDASAVPFEVRTLSCTTMPVASIWSAGPAGASAVLRMSRPLTFEPAALPPAKRMTASPAGTAAVMTGFGPAVSTERSEIEGVMTRPVSGDATGPAAPLTRTRSPLTASPVAFSRLQASASERQPFATVPAPLT